MAIAFDASAQIENQSAGTTATLSHTTSGANRLLLVAVHQSTVASDGVSSVTYNGVSMTKIGSTVTIESSVAYLSLWYLLAPATGANNIVVTKTSGYNTSIASVSYTGVKQSGQPEVNNTNTGSGTAPTCSMTPLTNNAMLVMSVGGNGTGGVATESSNWTRRANNFTKGSMGEKSVATPASTTQTVTFSGSQNWGVIQISIAEDVAVNITVNATVLSATFSIPSRTVTGGATVSPAVLSSTFSIPALTVTATRSVTVASTVFSATFSIPTLAVMTPDAYVQPSALSATFSTPASSVSGGATVSPSVLSATFSTPSVNVTGGTTSSPSPLTATFSIPSITVTTTRFVTVSASALEATFTIPVYSVLAQTNETVSPNVLSATFSTPAPVITTTRTVSVSASVLQSTFTIPAYTAVGTKDAIVSASVLSATFSTPAESYSLGATVFPSVLSATFSIPSFTVGAVRHVTAEPSTLTALLSLPTLAIVADFWQTKYPQVSIGDGTWADKY